MDDNKTLGQVAYEAWCGSIDMGETEPSRWGELGNDQRQAWETVGIAIHAEAVLGGSPWLSHFDERQQKQIAFARLYAQDFHHGADGHNNMLIIAKLADLLDGKG